MYKWVCVYIWVCIWICMYACIYAWVWVCVCGVYMYVGLYVFVILSMGMYVLCMPEHMHVCVLLLQSMKVRGSSFGSFLPSCVVGILNLALYFLGGKCLCPLREASCHPDLGFLSSLFQRVCVNMDSKLHLEIYNICACICFFQNPDSDIWILTPNVD